MFASRIGPLAVLLVLFAACDPPRATATVRTIADEHTDEERTVPSTPELALARLLSAQKISPKWFTSEFRAAVPTPSIERVINGLHAEYGVFKSVEGEGDHFNLTFERGVLVAETKIDASGRFVTLLVKPVPPKPKSITEALAAFRKFEGKIGVIVLTNDAERGGIEPDGVLAAGSSFKMAVLATLRDHVEANTRSWRDVVELNERDESSTLFANWPDKAPLTLYSLTALMIAKSDNTAADTLIDLIGRNAAEAYASRNKPLLRTRELFQLKAPENGALLEHYRAGDEAKKREVLSILEAAPPANEATYPRTPTALDVEYLFSPRELCGLMKRVHDLPFMGINPGIAQRSEWDSVAYKGGSESGVLSMTTWVTRKGKSHCVSATWNNGEKAVEVTRFEQAYTGMLAFLHDE